MKKLFDAQVNVGRSAIGPDCDMDTYLTHMQNRTTAVMLIPTPSHDHIYGDGTREISCMWEDNDGAVTYSVRRQRNGRQMEINPTNPYFDFNGAIIEQARVLTARTGIEFYVAAKCHPVLDSPERFEETLRAPEVRAIKIHGLATHTTPAQIPAWLPDLSKRTGVPFFIHTDYHQASTTATPMELLMSANTSKKWYAWVKEHDARAYLAHGLRLDLETLAAVSNDLNILIGIGPASLLQTEQDRLLVRTDNYLQTLLASTNPQRIAFCTDYRWNVWERQQWNNLDWSSDERTIETARQLGFSQENINGILHDNAEKFFMRN